MARPKVFVTRVIPDQGLHLVQQSCDAEVWQDELPPPPDVLHEKIRHVDGLLSLVTDRVDADLLDRASKLKVVSNMAVGFDNVDVPECTKRGIPVGNTPGVLTETTADFAFALLMAAARRIVEGHEYVRDGKWRTWGPMLLLGQDVHAATLGIVGFGRIGQAMARRAQGFGMRILYYDNEECVEEFTPGAEAASTRCADLDTVLRESDFVSLHTQLNEGSYHLMSDREFDLMKPDAILINTARGPVVDSEALVRALREGKIGYAALDVTEPEPIPAGHPLLSLPNCLVVPHMASGSVKTRGKMAEMAAQNLLAGLRGERLPNCVNPEVYV